jgi:hypothetical protein
MNGFAVRSQGLAGGIEYAYDEVTLFDGDSDLSGNAHGH